MVASSRERGQGRGVAGQALGESAREPAKERGPRAVDVCRPVAGQRDVADDVLDAVVRARIIGGAAGSAVRRATSSARKNATTEAETSAKL